MRQGATTMSKTALAKSTASSATLAPSGAYVSVKEAARLLKISEISVRRFLTLKRLRRFKVGSRTLVLQSEVLALVREVE
jgi:excisionase family DNA binding protein